MRRPCSCMVGGANGVYAPREKESGDQLREMLERIRQVAERDTSQAVAAASAASPDLAVAATTAAPEDSCRFSMNVDSPTLRLPQFACRISPTSFTVPRPPPSFTAESSASSRDASPAQTTTQASPFALLFSINSLSLTLESRYLRADGRFSKDLSG